MARLYKRGNVWWTVVHPHGEQSKRVTTGQRNRKAAERVARQLELENALPPEVPTVQLGDALDLAWEQRLLRQNAQATLDAAKVRGAHLLRVFHGRTEVGALSPRDLEGYLRTRRGEGVSDHTIAKELDELMLALRTAKRHGLFAGEPMSLWPEALRNYYEPRDRWLPVHEYQALLAEATPHRRDYIVVYCHTGIRYGELYRIKPEHIDLEGRRIFVDGTKTKAAKRWVPLSHDAYEVFSRREHFPVWQKGRMNQDLQKWCARAGIERVSCNDFRRTFASNLVNAGVPEIVTTKLLGHTNSNMVRRVYGQLSHDTLSDAIAQLPTVSNLYERKVVPLRKTSKNTYTQSVKAQ